MKLRTAFLLAFFCCFELYAQEVIYYCSKSTVPGSTWQVYRKNLTDGTTQAITNNPSYNHWKVVVSPNHQQLLILRSPASSSPDQENYENCDILKANADGSNQQIIVADNQNNWFAFGNPWWHPSGNRILMIAQAGTSADPFHLYTIDTTGNNPQQLSLQWAIDPNWSPDGNKIVFIGTTGITSLTQLELYTADYNYSQNSISNIQQLTNDTTRNHDPCFSPDGSHIAFMAGPADLIGADIVTIDTSGNNRTTLMDDNGTHGGQLNWGTDNKIYYHSLYLFVTDFMAKAFNTITNTDDTLLASPGNGYIHPYYINQDITSTHSAHQPESEPVVYPNPAKDIIAVKMDNIGEAYMIEITSLPGRLLLKSSNERSFDVSGLNPGMYILIIKQGDKRYTFKVIKE